MELNYEFIKYCFLSSNNKFSLKKFPVLIHRASTTRKLNDTTKKAIKNAI